MFPYNCWSCFHAPPHSQLSCTPSQTPPVTHIIQKHSADKPVFLNKHCPLPNSVFPIILLSNELLSESSFCSLIFPLYDLLLPTEVLGSIFAACFRTNRRKTSVVISPPPLTPPVQNASHWIVTLSSPGFYCRSSGASSMEPCQNGVGNLPPQSSSLLSGPFLWPSSQ